MKIDLNIGAFLQIGGELGKYHSIPIEVLAKLAKDFQKLILTIAQYDLASNEAINLANFIIELVDFKKGSAIPKFAYSRRAETMTGINWQIHRNSANEKFNKLLEIADHGDYSELRLIYPEPFKRNKIVKDLYEFANDFGNAPVAFVDYSEETDGIKPIYKINKFKSIIKDDLITDMPLTLVEDPASDIGVAQIRVSYRQGRTEKRILNFYTESDITLNYSPDMIVFTDKKYFLNYPLRCLFEKEENCYVIQSELLGIIGTGKTKNEAEQSFSEEFDYIYNKYNTLEDSELTNKIRFVKMVLNQLVKKSE